MTFSFIFFFLFFLWKSWRENREREREKERNNASPVIHIICVDNTSCNCCSVTVHCAFLLLLCMHQIYNTSASLRNHIILLHLWTTTAPEKSIVRIKLRENCKWKILFAIFMRFVGACCMAVWMDFRQFLLLEMRFLLLLSLTKWLDWLNANDDTNSVVVGVGLFFFFSFILPSSAWFLFRLLFICDLFISSVFIVVLILQHLMYVQNKWILIYILLHIFPEMKAKKNDKKNVPAVLVGKKKRTGRIALWENAWKYRICDYFYLNVHWKIIDLNFIFTTNDERTIVKYFYFYFFSLFFLFDRNVHFYIIIIKWR